MSSFGSHIRKRLDQLRRNGEDVVKVMREVARDATINAVEAATSITPPNGAELSGTNTRSGELAQHWATDSKTEPAFVGGAMTTYLKNDKEYASYVDKGHRMDKHFVPGLVKNGPMLEYNPDGKGGIMVGTKTTYVPGIHMTKKGIGAYRRTLRTELDKRVRKAMNK